MGASTPHSSKIYWPIVLKLTLKKHVQEATLHAKFGYDRNKGVAGANTQFVTIVGSTLCRFFVCVFFAPRPGHTAGPILTRDGSQHVFSAKEVPFGGLDDEK